MADLTVQDLDTDGESPSYVAADGNGDRFAPRTSGAAAKVLVHVKNTDTADHTVTLVDQSSQEPTGAAAFDPNVAVVVPAGGEMMIAPNNVSRFVDDDGWLNLTYDAVTGVEVGVFRL